MTPKFAIGSVVEFGGEQWRVIKYHKIWSDWEVMFLSLARGIHRSVFCSQLERYVQ